MDQQPTRHNKHVFPALASDDIKLLVITFAGTVVANIVTVLFVGLAIATSRAVNFAHDLSHTAFVLIIIYLTVTIGSLMMPVYVFVRLRRQRNSERKVFDGLPKKILIVLTTALAGIRLILALAWVGAAAGL